MYEFSFGVPFISKHAMQFFSFHAIVVVFSFHLDEHILHSHTHAHAYVHTYTPHLSTHSVRTYIRAHTHNKGATSFRLTCFTYWLGSVRLTSELFVNIISERANERRAFFQCVSLAFLSFSHRFFFSPSLSLVLNIKFSHFYPTNVYI